MGTRCYSIGYQNHTHSVRTFMLHRSLDLRCLLQLATEGPVYKSKKNRWAFPAKEISMREAPLVKKKKKNNDVGGGLRIEGGGLECQRQLRFFLAFLQRKDFHTNVVAAAGKRDRFNISACCPLVILSIF